MPGGFPKFSDGNVEIRFSEKDTYILHSWQLVLHSPWFKAALSDRWRTDSATNTDGKNYWVYELRFDKESTVATLVRPAEDGSTAKDTEMIPSCDSWSEDSDVESVDSLDPGDDRQIIAKAHRNLFCCLYHVTPAFSTYPEFDSFELVRDPIIKLVEAAKMYGCEEVVKIHVDNKLRIIEDQVQVVCSCRPLELLKFAIDIESDWIFKEAATHIIGRSNRFYDQSSAKLHEYGVCGPLSELRDGFVQRLKDIETQMFCMQVPPVAGPMGQQWLAYAALNFFRQWLTEQLQAGQGSGLGPGYANLYHTIYKGLFSYVNASQKQQVRNHMNKMQQIFTDDNMRDLEPEIKKVFKKAAAIVKPILIQRTRYQNPREDNHRALTFMTIPSSKMPWHEDS